MKKAKGNVKGRGGGGMRKNVMFEGRAVSSIPVQLKTKWTVEWLTYNSL